ncbi:MAG TPA: NEW3 domain-containing protein, partial [Candidatus Limnocylindria bacterium]|nr:NEW3 domain-containing protein [Candidatus Limnocylindria bacterium]
DVAVPDDATEGDQTITVVASGGGTTARLALDLHVAAQAGGTVGLKADFPALQGTSDQSFDFTLQLSNDTPQPLTFSLQASGPTGWQVSAHPTSQATAASVTVDAGANEGVTVTAKPPPDVATGDYPIALQAVSGDHTAQAQLGVHITGRVEMQLTTPDQRLNTNANAGEAKGLAVSVVNSGTSPLTGVALSGTGPTDWKITFTPATLDSVDPQQAAAATANITPSADAIAGDYVVTLTAKTQDTTETLDIRVTVETSPVWGVVGVLLILVALGGLAWVFRRYGRR